MTAKLHILMPVLNEEGNITRLLRGLEEFGKKIDGELSCRIILVDDGSSDGTMNALDNFDSGLDITVLRHKQNLGPGAAFATAFEYLRKRLNPSDWVVTMESDNTSSLQTLEQMLVRRKEGYECVLASPYSYGGGFVHTSVIRVAISHLGNTLVKIMFKLRGINTFSSFFRLYNANLMDRLYRSFGSRIVDSTGFECMVELLYKMVLVGARISEVEMKVDWSQREGKSKMRVIKTTRGYLRVMLKRTPWKTMAH